MGTLWGDPVENRNLLLHARSGRCACGGGGGRGRGREGEREGENGREEVVVSRSNQPPR